MADYAGAVAAIRTHFSSHWNETAIALPNTPPPDEPWPPAGPWVFVEVMSTGSEMRGAGKPGDHVWLTRGYVHVQIFVPKDYGVEESERLATAVGEVFRAKTIYADGSGTKVIFGAPLPNGLFVSERSSTGSETEGNQFGVTCSIPFEFFFRA